MQKRRQSLLFEGTVQIFEAIGSFFGKSRWFKRILTNGYEQIDEFAQRRVGENHKTCGVSKGRLGRFRRRWMVEWENSRILKWGSRLRVMLLEMPLWGYAFFFLLGGSLHGALRVLLRAPLSDLGFWMVTVLAVASFPLLFERQPLKDCLAESVLFSRITFKEFFQKNGERTTYRGWVLALTIGLFSVLYGAFTVMLPLMFWGGLSGLLLILLLIGAIPEIGLLGILLFLPLLEFFAHKTLLLVGFAAFFLMVWLLKLLVGRRQLLYSVPDALVAFLILSFAIGGISRVGGLQSLASGFTRALLLALYFPACGFFASSLWRKWGIFALQLSGFAVSVAGIVQYVQGKAQLQWVDLSRFSNIGGRVTSCFSNPNVLAVYLLLLIPIALCYAIGEEGRLYERFFFGICFASECGCLFLTWSRGAWLGCLASVLLVLLLFSIRTRAALLFMILPISCLASFLPRAARDRFGSIGNLGESSIRYRRYLWRGTLRMLKSNTWGIGIGEQAFSAGYLPYAVSGTETAAHSHQIFLQLFCEVGFVGVLVFVLLLLLIFLLLFQGGQEKRSNERRCAGIGGFCGILGAIVMGLFDHIWYHNGLFCLFWVVLAITRTNVGREGS